MPQYTLWQRRTSIRLGQEIGRGGEGVVYAVEGQKDWVAKIYASSPDSRPDPRKARIRAHKLAYMVKAATPRLQQFAAWPLDLLWSDDKGTVRVWGFVMLRADAREAIHELYTPKSRSKAFPTADFRFLVCVAANVARAFAVVHEEGHVLGDVNHGNVLVRSNGTVRLIDCDSFQIRRASNDVFTCDVGVPLFTAPELQGRPFRGLFRTPNHDRFGLAVLLFHLLYTGRHPFAGRYSGPGDMPIEKAISEYRFAYGPDRAANAMERPPHTIPLETMGPGVARLFIHAFGRAGSNGGRPNAKTWVGALEKLKSSLRDCWLDNRHCFPGELAACPWCTVELQTGMCLFGQRNAPAGPTEAIRALRRAIQAVPDPGTAPVLRSEQPCRPWYPPPWVKLPSRKPKMVRSVSIGLVFAGLVASSVPAKDGGIVIAALNFCIVAGAMWPWVSRRKKVEADRLYQEARNKWLDARKRWDKEAVRDAFDEKRKSLEDAYAEISALRWPQTRERNFQSNMRERTDWREIEARIQKLLSTLRQGPDDLRRISQEIKAARTRLRPELDKLWDDFKLAEAQRNALQFP